MSRELQNLLESINDKKADIRNHINNWSADEISKARGDLEEMQARFDLMRDLEESVPDEGDLTPIEPAPAEDAPKDAIHEFAQAARRRFTNINKEGTGIDGGYTVPEDIQTKINEWREANFALQSLVSTEKVKTMSGARTYMKKTDHTGFAPVAEGGKLTAKSGPQFERVTYTITKYGGYLPVTNELLADSDAAIYDVLIDWLKKEDVATRNGIVLEAVAEKDQTELTGLDDIKYAVNVTLGQAYSGTAVIVTNDDGLNYFDTLKDENKRYLLQPDINPANPFDMTIAVGARKIPVVVVPNAVLATTDEKIPVIIGDLKEYCRIFDRQQLSIMTSNVAAVGSGDNALNAFEEDLTIFRGIMRLDAEVVDDSAIVNGYITAEAAETGDTGDTGDTGNT